MRGCDELAPKKTVQKKARRKQRANKDSSALVSMTAEEAEKMQMVMASVWTKGNILLKMT